MKKCAICSLECENEHPTCPACGEATWVAFSPVPAPPVPTPLAYPEEKETQTPTDERPDAPESAKTPSAPAIVSSSLEPSLDRSAITRPEGIEPVERVEEPEPDPTPVDPPRRKGGPRKASPLG